MNADFKMFLIVVAAVLVGSLGNAIIMYNLPDKTRAELGLPAKTK